MGPAFVASIAYIDPGNFATNFTAGAQFGNQLLWVLLWSNAMAILIQYLSAKLGIATGRTLPQSCRDHFSRRTAVLLWLTAEISALATDLAEFLGAALGFYLLFGPWFLMHGWDRRETLLLAALVSTVLVFALLALELRGFRKLEVAIIAFVALIGLCYGAELALVHPLWSDVAHHILVPQVARLSIYAAVSMLGATVMPHVVYLHSALVQPRVQQETALAATPQEDLRIRRHLLRYEKIDILIAMNGAWLVNSAMVIVAAAAFAGNRAASDMTIEDAHRTLGPLLGQASATIFAVALLCSGLSSSTVGTMAGQVVLEGFLHVRFSIFLRRLLTLIPAILVIASGLDALRILVLSQVVLSFALPFALIPLLLLTGRASVMQGFANSRLTQRAGWAITAVIIALNGMLLWQIATT
ncbi:divalent metal cation transporter [Acidipila sp. EB88]|nr:divalent metal cation transporter [Acidipila sp. EB88]